VIEALWLNDDPPIEYLELILCRDVYHCTPVQLADVPLPTIIKHLACLDAELHVRKALK